jgi:hypothetical protein
MLIAGVQATARARRKTYRSRVFFPVLELTRSHRAGTGTAPLMLPASAPSGGRGHQSWHISSSTMMSENVRSREQPQQFLI